MNDITRKISLAGLGILVVSLTIGFLWMNRDVEIKGEVKKTYRSVRVSNVQLNNNNAEVQFSGKLSAKNRIDIFSEVSGVLLNDNFRVGNTFSLGDPLVLINSKEFEAILKAQKTQLIAQVSLIMGDLKLDFPNEYSDWNLFLNTIDVDSSLPKLPSVKNQKLKRFLSGKGVLNSYYSLKAQEEKLSKYVISAPYNGAVVNSMIKKGTLVMPGQKIGTYIDPTGYELETEVSLSDLQFISIGSVLDLKSTELNKSWKGKVIRINKSINPSSQMVKLYISVTGSFLKEGMFLNGVGRGTTFKNTLSINRKLIKNNGVYLVDSGKVKFKPVDVLYVNKSKAIIQGLDYGDQYILDNMKGLYEGMNVNVTYLNIPVNLKLNNEFEGKLKNELRKQEILKD